RPGALPVAGGAQVGEPDRGDSAVNRRLLGVVAGDGQVVAGAVPPPIPDGAALMVALDAGLGFFRRQQADQLEARATIRRLAGEPVTNPATGRVTQPVAVVSSATPCKVTSNETKGEDVQAGDTEVRLV